MPKCAVKRCTNNKLKVQKKEGISYFRFPQNPKRREKWRRVIVRDRDDESFQPSAHSLICSNHFSEHDMYLTERGLKRLKKSAIPCLQIGTASGESPERSETAVSSTTARADPLGSRMPLWRRADDYRLVALYRAHECLWRPASPAYRDRAARRAAWQRVAAALAPALRHAPGGALGVARVCCEVRRLRAAYAAELLRLERSLRRGAGNAYQPELLVFADMHAFLKDVVHVHRHSEADEESVIKVEYEPAYSEGEEDEDGEGEGADSVSVSAQGAWRGRGGVGSAGVAAGGSRDEDEFGAFAAHVRAQMRRLPLELALQAQDEIQSVLTRYRLQHVRQPPAPPHKHT